MNKLKKILLILLTLVVVLVGGFVLLVLTTWKKTFDAPMPEITISTDSAVIAHGEYLAYGPAHCSGCHSPKENLARIDAGEHLPLEGGFEFVLPIGTLRSPNITPDPETGIGSLSNQTIARALRHGVRRDGQAMLPLMPFQNMSEEDFVAIMSWLRTQKPVKKVVPDSEYNFLGKAIKAFVLKPEGPVAPPPASVTRDSSIAYGEYLAFAVANCRGCHTNRNLQTGEYIGEYYAGGLEMESGIDPTMMLRTPNLTPDPETGRIFGWSQAQFVQRFREGRKIPASDMPWPQYAQMSDSDLIAIFKFLNSLKPVKNEVNVTAYKKGEKPKDA